MRKPFVPVICLSLLAAAGLGHAVEQPRPGWQQKDGPGTGPAFPFPWLDNKDGRVGYAAGHGAGQPEILYVDASGVLKLIVEFKEPPLYVAAIETPGRVRSAAFYESRFGQFAADLESACNKLSAGTGGSSMPQPTVRRKFFKLFFGVSIEAPRAAVESILDLPYVKGLHVDQEVTVHLDDSVPLIRADQVWSRYGNQGEGVTVGIIDSGIDYMHPALGGGFGPGFKVVGGYDVVNNDADPLDDYGHGTHVAGIVAADGTDLKGVAPKSSLMAFKVMGQFGQGTLSTVMAGIERAVDPNDDGDPSDRVDVMNLSLGGSGHPNDPLAKAVDNAVRMGVAVCVSAGNDGGIGFWTVGTPGCARLAITVGASDKSDKVARFSSGGPSLLTNAIKPDVLAPGVDIRSSVPGGAYQPMSGTSMSSPHVAGVCALLKSIHPGWSPQQIKAALVTTAVDLGEEVMKQGAGRIDALSAAAVGTFAIPASLSFGNSDLSQREWTATSEIRLRNASGAAQQYTISFDGLRRGVRLKATPSKFTLAPSQSQPVTVTLTVDNRAVPVPKEGSLAYGGSVVVEGTSDKLHMPWAFVMGSEVALRLNKRFPDFILTSPTSMINNRNAATFGDGARYSFVVPAGTYELISISYPLPWIPDLAHRSTRISVKEKIAIKGSTRIDVDFSEASHALTLDPVDSQGQPLSSVENAEEIWFLMLPSGSLVQGIGFGGLRGSPLYCSNLSGDFKMIAAGAYWDLLETRKVHLIQHLLSGGVRGDIRLTNSPSDFMAQEIRLEFSPDSTQPGVDIGLVVAGGTSMHRPVPVDTHTWSGTFHLMKDLGQELVIGLGGMGYESIDPDQPFQLPYFTPPIRRREDGRVGAYSGRSPSPVDYLVPGGSGMVFGMAPVYPWVDSWNNVLGDSTFFAVPMILGPGGEDRTHADAARGTYTIRDRDGTVVVEGSNLETVQPVALRPGRYLFEVVLDEPSVTGEAARLRFTADFDLRKADPHPPTLTSLKLLNQKSLPVDASQGDVPVRVRLSAGDYDPKSGTQEYIRRGLEKTRLYYRICETQKWTELPLRTITEDSVGGLYPVGFVYEADLPQASPCTSGRIDLKCVVRDKSGNSTECLLEPAYERAAQMAAPLR